MCNLAWAKPNPKPLDAGCSSLGPILKADPLESNHHALDYWICCFLCNIKLGDQIYSTSNSLLSLSNLLAFIVEVFASWNLSYMVFNLREFTEMSVTKFLCSSLLSLLDQTRSFLSFPHIFQCDYSSFFPKNHIKVS